MSLTVGDQLAHTLRNAGVSQVFGMDDPQALYAGLRKHGIRPVIVHDERAGAFMADGYARASHRLSVCTGIGGPGATNLATALFEAYCSSVPVLAIVGESASGRADQHAFQALAHEQVFSSLTKGVVRLERGADANVAVGHAISLAVSGRPRPVLLLAPDAHLWETIAPASSPSEADSYALARMLEYPRARSGAAPAMLDLARRAIRAAQRPVILAGGGVNVAHAQDELLRVAERYGMLVALSVMGKGAFPETHPLALGVASSYTGGSIGHGAAATQALCEADLIMVVGSDLDALTTSGGMWPNAGVTVIRIDNDPTELLSHPAIQIHADAQVALAQLADGDGDLSASHDRQWHAEMQQRVADIRTAIGAYDASGSANGEVSPGRIVTEIHRHLSEGDAIVTDASYSSAWALDRVCQRWPGRFVFAPRGSGVLGWGFPASIGVKLARPHGQVVCMTGDGGLYFSIGELETAVRLNLDVTVVVLNNGSFGFQRHSDIARQSADPGDLCFGETVSYRDVARAFGWRAERVTSFGEFEEAYPAALADGSPTLIEVMVSEDEIPPILKFDRLRQGMPRMRSVPA